MNDTQDLEAASAALTDTLHTPFVDAFVAEFLENVNRPWPLPGQELPDVNTDLRTFTNVLTECALSISLPATVSNAGLNTELFARLVQFLDHYENPTVDPLKGWPSAPFVVAGVNFNTLRLWEASMVLEKVLGAVALRPDGPDEGGGGEGSKWPPHTGGG